MRPSHDEQVITLFDGEPIAVGYRGRHSTQNTNKNSFRIAIVVVALIGFATVTAAIAIRHANDNERSVSAGGNLAGGVSGSVGFEAALY